MAVAVRNAVFGLVEEDAPVDLKLATLELRQRRAQQAQAEAQAKHQIDVYTKQLSIAARAADGASFPASVDYYDGDHQRYTRALQRTAESMAARAEADGIYADLSPQAVQRQLESELDGKLTKVQQKRLARAAAKEAPKAPAATSKAEAESEDKPASPPSPTKSKPLTKSEMEEKLRLAGW